MFSILVSVLASGFVSDLLSSLDSALMIGFSIFVSAVFSFCSEAFVYIVEGYSIEVLLLVSVNSKNCYPVLVYFSRKSYGKYSVYDKIISSQTAAGGNEKGR